MILGLDIGGANTKAASADSKYAKSVYLPLWKNSPLEKVLKRINAEQKPEAVAVVITGRRADWHRQKGREWKASWPWHAVPSPVRSISGAMMDLPRNGAHKSD